MAVRTTYTLDEFYELIKSKINEENPNKPVFWGRGSIVRSLAKAMAYLGSYIQLQANILYSSVFIRYARGTHLRRLISNFGMSAKEASFAIAPQIFIGSSGRTSTVNIDAGTVVSREADVFGNIISYELVDSLTLLTGDASVSGYVVCQQIGTVGNAVSGSINVLDVPIVGIDSTYNLEDVTNGSEIESDEQIKTRVSDYLLGLKKGNESAILSAVRSVEGVTYVKISDNTPTAGNFTVFVSSENGILDSVTLFKVNEAINESKGFCVTATVITPTESNVTIEFDVTFEDNVDSLSQSNTLDQIKLDILNLINKANKNSVYRADIITLVKRTKGIKNVKNVFVEGVAQDLELSDLFITKVADVSDITINVV